MAKSLEAVAQYLRDLTTNDLRPHKTPMDVLTAIRGELEQTPANAVRDHFLTVVDKGARTMAQVAESIQNERRREAMKWDIVISVMTVLRLGLECGVEPRTNSERSTAAH